MAMNEGGGTEAAYKAAELNTKITSLITKLAIIIDETKSVVAEVLVSQTKFDGESDSDAK